MSPSFNSLISKFEGEVTSGWTLSLFVPCSKSGPHPFHQAVLPQYRWDVPGLEDSREQTATGCSPTAEVRDVCIDFLESILNSDLDGFGLVLMEAPESTDQRV